jgi:hypothetical protein
MLFAAGLVFLALGLLSGALLVLVPLGLTAGAAGITLWVLFPVFTIMGYLMSAASTQGATLPLLSRVTGVLLLVLGLVAGVALVLQGGAIMELRSDPFSLWYVLVLGVILGAVGLASHKREPERTSP